MEESEQGLERVHHASVLADPSLIPVISCQTVMDGYECSLYVGGRLELQSDGGGRSDVRRGGFRSALLTG